MRCCLVESETSRFCITNIINLAKFLTRNLLMVSPLQPLNVVNLPYTVGEYDNLGVVRPDMEFESGNAYF